MNSKLTASSTQKPYREFVENGIRMVQPEKHGESFVVQDSPQRIPNDAMAASQGRCGVNRQVVSLDGHGSLDFEAKNGALYLNGQLITRRTMSVINEASHLAMVASDLQIAEIRRKGRAK